jgi:hypothetical protein
MKGYGPVALYVGGTGEVRFKDVSWKDLNSIVDAPEEVSSKFTMKHVSSFYYGWSAAAADINKDGALDIVSGPFYYLGPSFSERRIYRTDRVYNPATESRPTWSTRFRLHWRWMARHSGLGIRAAQPAMDLYVNPHGEPRWDKSSAPDHC